MPRHSRCSPSGPIQCPQSACLLRARDAVWTKATNTSRPGIQTVFERGVKEATLGRAICGQGGKSLLQCSSNLPKWTTWQRSSRFTQNNYSETEISFGAVGWDWVKPDVDFSIGPLLVVVLYVSNVAHKCSWTGGGQNFWTGGATVGSKNLTEVPEQQPMGICFGDPMDRRKKVLQ